MDSGPIIAQRETVITEDENAEDLTARLFEMGAELLADTIYPWRDGKVAPVPQSEADVTITRLLKREDGAIDWTQSAERIARQIRAYHPWPSSFTHWNGRQLKVHEASALDGIESELPGTVMELTQDIAVATGEGALLLRRVQIEGRQATDISEFARGYRDFTGSRLGTS